MNYRKLLVLLSISFLAVSCTEKEKGTENQNHGQNPESECEGLFSVSASRQVKFSPGNLNEDADGFVEHQWDFGGLFEWGKKTHSVAYWDDGEQYWNYISQFEDWGKSLSGNWRTPSVDEWKYVYYHRKDAIRKRGNGLIQGSYGFILLPDEWTLPEGCEFYGGVAINRYTYTQWMKMAANGAVFFPTQSNDTVDGIVTTHKGLYWASTDNEAFIRYADTLNPHLFWHRAGGIEQPDSCDNGPIYRGPWGLNQVRLIKDK